MAPIFIGSCYKLPYTGMAEILSFETRWGRHVGLLVVGWLLASALAIVLLLTFVRDIFV